MPDSPDNPLITAEELREALGSGEPPVVLDVRSGHAGLAAFLAAHLPTAVYVDLQADLSGPGSPQDGRTPLPAAELLQEAMRSWGISSARPVVVYDDARGLTAARAWWLLRWAGHSQVRLLDGGLSAWRAAGCEIGTELVAPTRGHVTVRPGSLPVWTAADVVALPATGVLVDAREPARYSGQAEPLDPVAGHIPGAISLPTSGNLASNGRFLPSTELRARFHENGLEGRDPIVVYCGSGVAAAHELVALQVAGLEGVIYPPSWSGWIADPARPVAIGESPLRSIAAINDGKRDVQAQGAAAPDQLPGGR
jgi:thiosulfate/3-mercaptopyruvate sulfurtransferase